MPSPITGADFNNSAPAETVCEAFTNKLQNNNLLKQLLEYLFDEDGNIGEDFAKDLVPLLKPIGSLELAPVGLAPDDAEYLECVGQAVSRTTYAKLFAKLGTTFGAGDGTTTFNLPDFRGRYLRSSSGAIVPGSQGGSNSVTLTSENFKHRHVFGHVAGSDDSRFLKNSTALPLSGSLVAAMVQGLGDEDIENITLGNHVTDYPTDVSPQALTVTPEFIAVTVYIKANHKISGVIL